MPDRIFKITLLFFLFTYLCPHSKGQDIKYLSKNAFDLSSGNMKGRGYVENGLERAAEYIHHQFDSLGLKSFKKDYCQKFEMAVNTFPLDPLVSLNGEELIAGVHYHIDPSSGDAVGSFEPLVFDKDNIGEIPAPGRLIIPGKKIILVLDISEVTDKDTLGLFNSLKVAHSQYLPVILLTGKKLTWSVSSKKREHAIIEISSLHYREDCRRIELEVKSKFVPNYTAMNMIAMIKGKHEPDSFIVFTAHYDHLGMMGTKACFYGANDNASGLSYLLEMARHYSKIENKYSMVFIAFAGEEAGLVGSKYFVENSLFDIQKIRFLLNIDLMGNGDEGITVVNGTLFKTEFKWLTQINKNDSLISKIKIRGPAANSDHYWFTQKGVPSFFIYTMGGSPAYHDVNDRFENLNFSEFQDLFSLLTSFVKKF